MKRHSRNTKILGIILIIGSALFAIRLWAVRDFVHAYATYTASAARHNSAAFIPAMADNPLRKELNAALSDVLAGTLTPNERSARARDGLRLIHDAEAQIDLIGDAGIATEEAILQMEESAVMIGQLHRSDLRDIIQLSRARFDIIADIRGLSYRANHHTSQIFERVIADEGALSTAHVEDLNRLIPSVEAQFDTRSNLYDDLERLSRQMESKYDDLPWW